MGAKIGAWILVALFSHSIFSVLSVSSVVHSLFGSGFIGLGFKKNRRKSCTYDY